MPSCVRPPGRGSPNESVKEVGPLTGQVWSHPDPDTGGGEPVPGVPPDGVPPVVPGVDAACSTASRCCRSAARAS